MNNIERLEKEIWEIKNSVSYKVGRAITFPIRKVYDFFVISYPIKKLLVTHSININNNYRILKNFNSQNKKCIYTFIIGDYDDLKEPFSISEGWDYICFTDNKKLKSNTWTIIFLDSNFFWNYPDCPKKRAMLIMIEYYKFIPKYYDIVVSIGGQIVINTNLDTLISKFFNINIHDFGICYHPERDCIYDEAEVCKIIKKDDSNIIDKHITTYKKNGYPKHNGLFMTGIIIRNNKSNRLKHMCNIWAKELIKGSKRDQLSLNYAIWKSKFPLSINGLNSSELFGLNPDNFLIIMPHNKDNIL